LDLEKYDVNDVYELSPLSLLLILCEVNLQQNSLGDWEYAVVVFSYTRAHEGW